MGIFSSFTAKWRILSSTEDRAVVTDGKTFVPVDLSSDKPMWDKKYRISSEVIKKLQERIDSRLLAKGEARGKLR